MIQLRSCLDRSDNFGIIKARVIKSHNKFNFNKSQLGNLVLISVLKKNPIKKKVKSKMYLAVIVSLKKKNRRVNGYCIRFDLNRFIPLSNNFEHMSTNIKFSLCKELRNLPNKKVSFKRLLRYTKNVI